MITAFHNFRLAASGGWGSFEKPPQTPQNFCLDGGPGGAAPWPSESPRSAAGGIKWIS